MAEPRNPQDRIPDPVRVGSSRDGGPGHWRRVVSGYAVADDQTAGRELAVTVLASLILLALGLIAARKSSFYGLLVAPLLAPALVRLFVIQHDCGHGAFFSSRRRNDATGRLLSLFTLFPYEQWRRSHQKHHASIGNLAQRGIGDVWTITVAEYRSFSRIGRFCYRLYRHPAVLIGLGGPYYTLLRNRLPRRRLEGSLIAPFMSSQGLNLAIAVALACLAQIGWLRPFLWIWIPAVSLGGSLGIVFFYAGHQFEGAYWSGERDWQPTRAALDGSAYLALTEPWAWLTGYIGIHHVHHLNSRVPMYILQRCINENPELARINRLTPAAALRATRLALWDEASQRLVAFPH